MPFQFKRLYLRWLSQATLTLLRSILGVGESSMRKFVPKILVGLQNLQTAWTATPSPDLEMEVLLCFVEDAS